MAETSPNPIPNLPGGSTDPLAQLRDIHLPGPIETWPPAPGWWLLGTIAIAAIACAAWWLYRRWRQNRYRREALGELSALWADFEAHANPRDYVIGYSALLKRVAMTRYPRDVVANLTGERWVEFLDQTGGGNEFSLGAGQILVAGGYESTALETPPAEIQRLHDIGALWIKHHRETVPMQEQTS